MSVEIITVSEFFSRYVTGIRKGSGFLLCMILVARTALLL